MQDTLWRMQWPYVRTHSVFYMQKFGNRFPATIELDALPSLPTTDKQELLADQEKTSPFGEYVACPQECIIRLHRTSGTTGRPLNLANSRKDLEWTAKLGGRAFFASGLRPGDRVVHCLNYCIWTGGLTDHLALEAAGACVIPFGVGNSRQLLETISDLKVTAISCTPSYPAVLEKILQDEGQKQPRELGLRLALLGGEAGLDNNEFRQNLERKWGFAVRNANYGLSEVVSIIGSQCEHTSEFHFHVSDFVFVEILDAASNPLPLENGTVGELVCTHLRKECQPLVRYRTRDVIKVTGTERCSCGRTSWRFRVIGRTDDMFNVRGINVFPTAVQAVIVGQPSLTTGQFRISLQGPGPYDHLALKVEAAPKLPRTEWPAAIQQIEHTLRVRLGVTTKVSLIEAGSLPLTDGKTNWIERNPL